VHQVGDQKRLYYDGRSTNHQDKTSLYLDLSNLEEDSMFSRNNGFRFYVTQRHVPERRNPQVHFGTSNYSRRL